MAVRSNLVNLDAMIKREDFAASEPEDAQSYETVDTISLRDFTSGGLIGPSLRKPDFQRETNHWTPEQVVSLLECFIKGDLIPSVILWKSPTFLLALCALIRDGSPGEPLQEDIGWRGPEGRGIRSRRCAAENSRGCWSRRRS